MQLDTLLYRVAERELDDAPGPAEPKWRIQRSLPRRRERKTALAAPLSRSLCGAAAAARPAPAGANLRHSGRRTRPHLVRGPALARRPHLHRCADAVDR